jgi:hypothetical protein
LKLSRSGGTHPRAASETPRAERSVRAASYRKPLTSFTVFRSSDLHISPDIASVYQIHLICLSASFLTCFVIMDFPTDVAEFDKDPRISFSKLDNGYLLETSDGREFLFNTILKRWVESVRDPYWHVGALRRAVHMPADNPWC